MLTSEPAATAHKRRAAASPPGQGVIPEQLRGMTFDGYPCSYRLLQHPSAQTEPFVLLGGALQDKYAWVPGEGPFRAVSDIMTIDLPGWGDVPVLPSRYGFDFLADALAAAMDHAGIAKANIVGACYGGLIGYIFAKRHPDRAASLAMVSAQDGLSDETRAGFHRAIDALKADDLDTFLQIVVDLYLPPSVTAAHRRRKAIARVLRGQMRQLPARAFDNYIQGTLRLLDFRTEFSPLPLPTLVVNGEQDTFTPPSGGRRLADRLDASFALIDGGGHMLGLERPVETTERITSFILGRQTAQTPQLPFSRAPHPI
ncbi:alpha/beta hydrolase [Streptomyces sp. N2-109]|uniref:Alpha/beta hydrolase n=1 Tax=Streptomyces gossypii TaxID=2883101 RepID=A0ABT2JXN0_9ACTN|nr:alpha/beta hydrolase [Streptomyces gossypii]MCT2592640.1 alpha/beta hydrolase [Streptomyces gossypii]